MLKKRIKMTRIANFREKTGQNQAIVRIPEKSPFCPFSP
jgi:hypothetical protein